jgi:hypothetical protein
MADKKISALTGATTPLAGTEVLPIVQGGSTVKVSVADLTAGRTVTVSALGVGTASPLTTFNVEGGTFLLRGGPMDIGPTSGATGAARISSSLTNGVEGKLIFSTSNSSAAITEAMNIDKDGNVTNTIGNVVIGTAGKGIDFSANTHAAGMTSELLNDYEEGTWTPVVRGSGAAGTYELASSAAYYTAIGRLVTLHMTLTTAGSVTGGGTGYLQITGVPFANAAFATGTVYLQGVDFTADYVVCNFTSASGSSILYFEEVRDAASSGDLPVSAIATNDTIRLTIQYIR